MSAISIRIKVFALFAAAALLTVVPALVLIANAVEERVYERATDELLAANESLRTYWRIQDEGLIESARRVALERGVEEHLLRGDSIALRRSLGAVVQRLVVVAVDSIGTTLVGPPVDTALIASGQRE